METSAHNLSTLFSQLGLPDQPADIDVFIATHHLRSGTTLDAAAFWTPVQAALLRQGLADDADWSSAIDELATRLS